MKLFSRVVSRIRFLGIHYHNIIGGLLSLPEPKGNLTATLPTCGANKQEQDSLKIGAKTTHPSYPVRTLFILLLLVGPLYQQDGYLSVRKVLQ